MFNLFFSDDNNWISIGGVDVTLIQQKIIRLQSKTETEVHDSINWTFIGDSNKWELPIHHVSFQDG